MKKWVKKAILISSIVVPVLITLPLVIYFNVNKKKSDEINRVNTFSDYNPGAAPNIIYTDLGEVQRKVNKNYYQTEMNNKYSNYGFVYPGHYNNYEKNDQIRYINYNGTKIDMCDELLNERVIDKNGNYVLDQKGEPYRYNDVNFISNEIKNNNLKRHPASDNWFAESIPDSIPSTTRYFTVSTNMIGDIPLGLYAAPGEIVEVIFDDDTWQLLLEKNFNNISFNFNNNYWGNYPADNSGRISNRYPFLQTNFKINLSNKSLLIGSPMGGHISVSIGRRLDSSGFDGTTTHSVSFTVKNAIKTLYYIHNFTTENEWNQQIEDYKNKKIIGCNFAYSTQFASMNLPFTNINELGYINIDELIYPYEASKRLSEYLYLSNYFGDNLDWTGIRIVQMMPCDDIWGGAAAWGGGYAIYCDIGSISKLLLADAYKHNWWSFSYWLFLHELNHNFERNNAFFRQTPHMHGQTNQVSTWINSIIGDVTRYRNEENHNGPGYVGWSKLLTPYSSMLKINTTSAISDEYDFYIQLLNVIGPKNYVDYVRWDAKNHSNWQSNWTHLEEIKQWSKSFGLNFWPAVQNYGNRYWPNFDGPFSQVAGDRIWPASDSEATPSQKEIIDELNKNYPAFDFVTCLYATGQYLYNSSINTFTYTGDTQAAFEIVPGQTKVFEFDKYLISANEDFAWNNLKIVSDSILGANVYINPNNNKQIIYEPNIKNFNLTDEFTISITPNFKSKPKYYVPEYRFKIKVRQSYDLPQSYTYPIFSIQNESVENYFSRLNNMEPEKVQNVSHFATNNFWSDKKQGFQYKFIYKVPNDGDYEFFSKWDDSIQVKINNDIVFQNNNYNRDYLSIYKGSYKKNDILQFEINVINISEAAGFELMVKENNKKQLDFMQNIYSPNILTACEENKINFDQIDETFRYRHRALNYNDYPSNYLLNIDYSLSHTNPIAIDKQKYYLESPYNKDIDSILSEIDGKNLELWNEDAGVRQTKLVFDINSSSDDPISLGSLIFTNRTSNWADRRASTIKIEMFNEEKNTWDPIHEGAHGSQFNDRFQKNTIINLDKTYSAKQFRITMINEDNPCISLDALAIYETNFYKNVSIFDINPSLGMYGKWSHVKNSQLNFINQIGNIYQSVSSGNYIEFYAENLDAIKLVGSYDNNLGLDIYIDDVLVENPTIYNNIIQGINNQQELLFLKIPSRNKHKIKIVHSNNDSLYINYIIGMKNSISGNSPKIYY